MTETTLNNQQFFDRLTTCRRDNDEVVEFYNDTAKGYNKLLHDSGYTDLTNYCSDLLKEMLGPGFESKEILDVACGTGKSGNSLKKSGFQKIDGVDAAREMVNVARDLGLYRDLSISKITKDEGLNYKDATYDAIFCIGSFSKGHIALKHGIPEFLRLLRQGGVAVYTVQYSLDKAEAFKDQLPLLETKQLEILKLENRFCHMVNEVPVDCHVYAIRKL